MKSNIVVFLVGLVIGGTLCMLMLNNDSDIVIDSETNRKLKEEYSLLEDSLKDLKKEIVIKDKEIRKYDSLWQAGKDNLNNMNYENNTEDYTYIDTLNMDSIIIDITDYYKAK